MRCGYIGNPRGHPFGFFYTTADITYETSASSNLVGLGFILLPVMYTEMDREKIEKRGRRRQNDDRKRLRAHYFPPMLSPPFTKSKTRNDTGVGKCVHV